MTADFPVVLDACVLVPASLRDTLLRCAERRIYLPRWSNEILDELRRTLLEKLSRSPEQVDHLLAELDQHFADARVEGFETLIALMTNDPGGRHATAPAVRCGAEAIGTFNLRHLPDTALDTWNIEVQHPHEFLGVMSDLQGRVDLPRAVYVNYQWLEARRIDLKFVPSNRNDRKRILSPVVGGRGLVVRLLVLLTVTVAPATKAPLGSLTIPETLAATSAHAAPSKEHSTTTPHKSLFIAEPAPTLSFFSPDLGHEQTARRGDLLWTGARRGLPACFHHSVRLSPR